MRPISIMVYWQDYLLGRHIPFADRGFSIVSAGHSSDSDFLIRQAYLLRKHKYAASSGVGSHMFYSIHTGNPFHIVQSDYEYVIGDHKAFPDTIGEEDALNWTQSRAGDDLASSFSGFAEAVTSEQQELTDYYLGISYAMSPGEMADFLRWLVRLDRFGRIMLWSPTARKAGADGTAVRGWVPSAVRRFFIRMRRAVGVLCSNPARFVRRVFPFLRK